MMNGYRQIVRTVFMAGLMALGSHSYAVENPDNILGYWRVMDDRSGFAKAIARFSKNADGTYVGAMTLLGIVDQAMAKPSWPAFMNWVPTAKYDNFLKYTPADGAAL